jgi:hypothetical protein
MSWFGGGGKSNNGAGSYEPENNYEESNNYQGQQEQYAAPRSMGAGGGGGADSFQQEVLMEQQKALIQAVMFKLTEAAFAKCITAPSSSLSSSKPQQILHNMALKHKFSSLRLLFNSIAMSCI